MTDEEAARPQTVQNNWVESGSQPAYDEAALRKQYEAMYGKRYDDDGGCCTCGGLLKLLLLMIIAIIGCIGAFAYTNPDWEGWDVLMPTFPDNASYIDMATHGFDHFKSEETWSNFGDYLITNTTPAMEVRKAWDTFQNNSIGEFIVDMWDNLDLMNNTLFNSIEDAIDTVNGTVQDTMKKSALIVDNSTVVTQFLTDTWASLNTMVSDYSGGKDIWETIEDFGKNLTELAHSKFNDTLDMVKG